MHTLEVDGVQLTFGHKRILNDVYFKCETGSITGLLGRNGQGKSCLMNIVYGSMQTSDKSVRINNKSVNQPFRGGNLVTFLPQHPFIPGQLTLNRIFKDFGILWDEFEHYFPELKNEGVKTIQSLSGGQRRLVEVYVIIKSKACFSMLDNPFSQIMPLHMEQIITLLQYEKKHKGFFITDQLYRQFVNICDALYVLHDGKTYLARSPYDLERYGYLNTPLK